MSVNLDAAKRKKATLEKFTEKDIERVIKSRNSSSQEWTRKSIVIDNDLLSLVDSTRKRERKKFAEFVREAIIDALQKRGLEI